jgi:hypothetical protein
VDTLPIGALSLTAVYSDCHRNFAGLQYRGLTNRAIGTARAFRPIHNHCNAGKFSVRLSCQPVRQRLAGRSDSRI